MKRLVRWLGGLLVIVVLLVGGLLAAGYRGDLPAAELEARYATGASKFVELEGLRIHYRDEGQGPVVVLLHGTGASLHTWDGWAADLSKGHRVIRLDLPGFGLTGPDPRGDYSMQRGVSVLERFLAHLGVARATLIGNSYGGRLAWSYALAQPAQVEALVLVDAAGYPQPQLSPAFRLAQLPVANRVVRWVTPDFLVEKTLREVYVDDTRISAELIRRYAELTRRTGNRQALIERLRTVYPDDTARLTGIKVPALILWGREDAYIPVEHASRFQAAIPGAQLVVLDKLGHVPMEEDPVRSLAPVLAFLSTPRT